MKRAINAASIRSVLAKVPRIFPNALTFAGESCRAGISAASKFAKTPFVAARSLEADQSIRTAGDLLQFRNFVVRVWQAKLTALALAMDVKPIVRDVQANDLRM